MRALVLGFGGMAASSAYIVAIDVADILSLLARVAAIICLFIANSKGVGRIVLLTVVASLIWLGDMLLLAGSFFGGFLLAVGVLCLAAYANLGASRLRRAWQLVANRWLRITLLLAWLIPILPSACQNITPRSRQVRHAQEMLADAADGLSLNLFLFCVSFVILAIVFTLALRTGRLATRAATDQHESSVFS